MVLTAGPQARAHGPSSSAGAGLLRDRALWADPERDTVGGMVDAPGKVEAGVGVVGAAAGAVADAVAGAAAGVAVAAAGAAGAACSGLAWERKAQAHDGDDQIRDAAAGELRREQA